MKSIILLFLFGMFGCSEYSPPDNFSCSGESFPAKWDDGLQIYKVVNEDMRLSLRSKEGGRQELLFKLSQDGFDYHLTVKDAVESEHFKVSNDKEALIKLVKLADDITINDFTYHKYAMSFTQGANNREGYCLGYKS